MSTSNNEGMQINLTDREAAELAFNALQDDPDSLILLLEGIKEQASLLAVHLLIDDAIHELARLSSVHRELKDDYIRIIVRKYRRK